MKKLSILLLFVLSIGVVLPAIAKMPDNSVESIEKEKTERYIKYVYDNINFRKVNKMSFECFKTAYTGYLNLIEAGKIKNNALLTVCDFTLSSNVKRLWTINVNKKEVIYNTLVAHGRGSGEEYATQFSNMNESHQSSLGFYVTGERYIGDNGISMKLHGIDGNFNNKAFERAVVMHGADYVSEQYAKDNIRLGRSWGCPAVARNIAEPMIDKLENGTCLFIYHNSKQYLKTSYWVNNTIKNLPSDSYLMDLKKIPNSNPRFVETAEVVKKEILTKKEVLKEKYTAPLSAITVKKIPTPEEIDHQVLASVSETDKQQFKVSVQTIKLSKEEVEAIKKQKLNNNNVINNSKVISNIVAGK